MMYCMAYIIISIVIPLMTWLFDPKTTYVPKRLRWNRTNAVFNTLWALVSTLGTMVCDGILATKVDRKYRRGITKGRRKHNGRQLVIRVNEAVAMSTQKSDQPQIYVNVVKFDTDSHAIGLDNRCTACISNRIEDFEGPVTKTDRTIRAFAGGRVANVYTGTIVWKWLNDEGKQFKFRVPHSYFVPEGGCRLLSPQHWAKSQSRIAKRKPSFGETTLQDKSIIFWGDNKLTIPLGRDDNVATFRTAPGFDKYDLFCQKCEISEYEKLTRLLIINDT